MKAKPIIATLMLAFVVSSVAYMAVKDPARSGGGDAPSGDIFAVIDGVEPDVIVYYFYNDIRCTTCKNLEGYTREALETHFAEDLASGAVQWRMLSMDDPANEHYLIDYGLYSKSVVLARLEDGQEVRFINLEEIWDLVYDKPGFIEYIRENVQDFLEVSP